MHPERASDGQDAGRTVAARPARTGWARLPVGREVLALCAVIFLADIIAGILLSSFSVYARTTGVSLATLGAVTTIAGFVQLGAALPLGALSDVVGRRAVLLAGMLAFVLAMLCLAFTGELAALVAARVLFGLAGIAVFQVGSAYLGDLTVPEQRPVAFGLLTTAMGAGFAVGPLLGGQIADQLGYGAAYLAGAAVGLAGLALALRMLRPRRTAPGMLTSRPRGRALDGARLVLGQPRLLLVTFGNLLVSLTFAGAVTTFFPLLGRDLALSQAAIGTMFAARAAISTAGRFPNSVIARRLGNQAVMLGAILANIIAMFGIAATTNQLALTALLALEGLAFGAYLVSGQTEVANQTTLANRGTAIGVYATASGVGGAVAPLLLGMAADAWGVRTVFVVTGWVLVLGFAVCLMGVVALRRGRPAAGAG